MIGIGRDHFKRLLPNAIQSVLLLELVDPVAATAGKLLPDILPELIEAAHALTILMALSHDLQNGVVFLTAFAKDAFLPFVESGP